MAATISEASITVALVVLRMLSAIGWPPERQRPAGSIAALRQQPPEPQRPPERQRPDGGPLGAFHRGHHPLLLPVSELRLVAHRYQFSLQRFQQLAGLGIVSAPAADAQEAPAALLIDHEDHGRRARAICVRCDRGSDASIVG